MKLHTPQSFGKRAAASVASLCVGAALLATANSAGAADALGTVAAFAPESGAALNGGLISWQNEVLATKGGTGGFTAFNTSTGAAASSPLTPTGVVKSPIVFNNLLTWIDSTANVVRTANPGGTVTALTGSVAGYDTMIAVGNDLWLTKPGGVDKFTPNLSTNALGGATTVGGFLLSSTLRAAVGPDGNVWVIEKGAGVDRLFRFNPAGASLGSLNFSTDGDDPTAIALGADGAMWVVLSGAGKVARFETNLARTDINATGIGVVIAGPGGAWVTEPAQNNIARLTFAAGTITRTPFSAPSSFGLRDLIVGSDGNIWAAGSVANRVAKFGTVAPTTTAPTSTSTTTIAPTTVAVTTTTTTTTLPATVPPTVKAAPVRRCVKTARRRVKVGKKFVTKTVCIRYRTS